MRFSLSGVNVIFSFEVEDNWIKVLLKIEVCPVHMGILVSLDGKGYW